VAPPGGEDPGPSAVLGGEEGYDLVEGVVGEGADAIFAFSIFPNCGRHRSDPLGARTAPLHFDLHGEQKRPGFASVKAQGVKGDQC